MEFNEWWNSVNHTAVITKAAYGSDTPTEDMCRLAWNAAKAPWISVDERLPEMNTAVLASNSKYVDLMTRGPSDDGWLWYDGRGSYTPDVITHWMPLPEPPK